MRRWFSLGVFLGGLLWLFGTAIVHVHGQAVSRTTTVAGGPSGQGFIGDFDSGMVTVPNSVTLVTSSSILVSSIYCHNLTGVSHTITIQDSNAVVYVPTVTLTANQVIQFVNAGSKGIQMSGFKWGADAANVINCQVSGWN
jgi:hypothetical protein